MHCALILWLGALIFASRPRGPKLPFPAGLDLFVSIFELQPFKTFLRGLCSGPETAQNTEVAKNRFYKLPTFGVLVGGFRSGVRFWSLHGSPPDLRPLPVPHVAPRPTRPTPARPTPATISC